MSRPSPSTWELLDRSGDEPDIGRKVPDMSNPTEEPVSAAEARWVAAERAGDVDALRRLLTDDFVGVGPLGFLLTKDQWIGRHADGLSYTDYAVTDSTTREYGTAAIVVAVHRQAGSYQGRDVTGQFRVTAVFVTDGGRRLAGVQLSALGPPR
jgi:ketosteroid isomerase-like protein